MRVFVTGASGWIGSAVTRELIATGHEVVGLARSDAAAAKVEVLGAEVLRGTVGDLDVLRSGASGADGVIHLAFRHDIAFSGGFQEAVDSDRHAVEVLGEALAGSGRPFVLASGLIGVAPGKVATEADGQEAGLGTGLYDEGGWTRLDTAHYVRDLAASGVRSSVVRLAPTNHGEGDHGFLATLVATARRNGTAGYVGDGSQRWCAAHRLDSAHLFCLALESAPAGSTLHAVAEEGVALKDIAEVIGRHLEVPAVSVDPADAQAHFGWLGAAVAVDCPASSALTRDLLGWQPVQPGLLSDLDLGHYFRS